MSIHNIGAVETQRNLEKEKRKLDGLASRRRARGARLLNTTAMKYNNDTTTLRAQRKAKRQKEWQDMKTAEQEAAYEKAMNEETERYARIKHIKKMREKKGLEQYWKMQHRAKATTNPEFDLNDPLSLMNDKPARVGDNDPRCGVSSLQMFEGEDLGKAQREKKQWAALGADRNVQIEQNNVARAKELQAKRAYEKFVKEQTQLRKINAYAKHQKKLQTDWEYHQINKEMARSTREENRRLKREADALGQLETQMTLANRRLAEDSSFSGKSELSQYRLRTDHFKGFTAAQMRETYAENARQMQEKQAALEAERAREAGYAAHVKKMYEVSRQQAAERAFQLRQDAQIAKCERKMQAREHCSREKADQKRIMDQKVTDQFLGKFGTSF